jgi:signal transduction histidine kinase
LEAVVRKSDLEEQIEALQDVLTDIREMIYGALEPTDEEADSQVESLRNVLADIEDMIDSTLEPMEDEEEEPEDEEDADR